METIIAINEIDNEDGYAGYSIETSQQVIKMLIANYQDCCESWGYFLSEDDITRFIGSKLLDIEITDTALNTEKIIDVYDGDTMFVNVKTNIGVLQFVAYNAHNGYYGHSAIVSSTQLQFETTL